MYFHKYSAPHLSVNINYIIGILADVTLKRMIFFFLCILFFPWILRVEILSCALYNRAGFFASAFESRLSYNAARKLSPVTRIITSIAYRYASCMYNICICIYGGWMFLFFFFYFFACVYIHVAVDFNRLIKARQKKCLRVSAVWAHVRTRNIVYVTKRLYLIWFRRPRKVFSTLARATFNRRVYVYRIFANVCMCVCVCK